MTFQMIATWARLGWIPMSARTRVFAVAAAAAVVVIGAVVGVTLFQTRGETTTAAGSVTKPRPGVPPLLFDFGVRADAETQALARGAVLLKRGKRAAAAAIFGHYHSTQAQIGAAFARWPDGSLDAIKQIWKDRVTTVFVNQGHYAKDPAVFSRYVPADVRLERIGDFAELPEDQFQSMIHSSSKGK